jgi:hypothetical protein
MQRPPSPQTAQHLRPALRVGLIAGLTLALAAVAQQFSASPDMRTLGMVIIVIGFSVTGFFAARESHVHQRNAGSSLGAISGLIAGVCVSLAFIAISLILSFDQDNLRVLQAQVEQQLSPSQVQQLRAADIDMKTLTQFSLGLTVTCCGLGFPVIGLLLGALGGASGAALRM